MSDAKAYARIIKIAASLATPLMFPDDGQPQPSPTQWATHKRLMDSMSPMVDRVAHAGLR